MTLKLLYIQSGSTTTVKKQFPKYDYLFSSGKILYIPALLFLINQVSVSCLHKQRKYLNDGEKPTAKD